MANIKINQLQLSESELIDLSDKNQLQYISGGRLVQYIDTNGDGIADIKRVYDNRGNWKKDKPL
ncbi:hypothetical protein [Moorena sp. SIO3I6]|uniref:hypothetical protein n=1 Tax=Moorena sp. SIO3I6 TaxID=2607831 RepID=UPI0013F82496|nr:hypothetical protein [Moorena sp. SIO3I6]NEP28096.1 hypothetical protein [Moorena sp. SIO3I6]